MCFYHLNTQYVLFTFSDTKLCVACFCFCIPLHLFIWLTLFTTCSVTYTCHRIPIWNWMKMDPGSSIVAAKSANHYIMPHPQDVIQSKNMLKQHIKGSLITNFKQYQLICKRNWSNFTWWQLSFVLDFDLLSWLRLGRPLSRPLQPQAGSSQPHDPSQDCYK